MRRKLCTQRAERPWHCCPGRLEVPEAVGGGLEQPELVGDIQPTTGVGDGKALRSLPNPPFYDAMISRVVGSPK